MPTFDLDDQRKRTSHSEPQDGDAHQPIAGPNRFFKEWLRQVAAGRIDETAEEIDRALKGYLEISDATVLGAHERW